MSEHCQGTNAAGLPCGMPPVTGSAFCFVHDPAYADDRLASRQLGGTHRRRGSGGPPRSMHSVEEIRAVAEEVLGDALGMDQGFPRTKSVVALLSLGHRLIESTEIETRLQKIEQAIAAMEVNPDHGRF